MLDRSVLKPNDMVLTLGVGYGVRILPKAASKETFF
jgi:hypothetical protein